MALSFLNKRSDCEHRVRMRIEIAGMSREVCESCGKVSIAYVDSYVHQTRLQTFTDSAPETSSVSGD